MTTTTWFVFIGLLLLVARVNSCYAKIRSASACCNAQTGAPGNSTMVITS